MQRVRPLVVDFVGRFFFNRGIVCFARGRGLTVLLSWNLKVWWSTKEACGLASSAVIKCYSYTYLIFFYLYDFFVFLVLFSKKTVKLITCKLWGLKYWTICHAMWGIVLLVHQNSHILDIQCSVSMLVNPIGTIMLRTLSDQWQRK